MRGECGSAALLGLIMMMLLSTLGAALLLLSKTDLQIAANHRDGIAAQYLAEAGVQYAVAKLKTDPDYVSQTKMNAQVTASAPLGTLPTVGSYIVQVGPDLSVSNTNIRLVMSTGAVNQAKRRVVANITLPVKPIEDNSFTIIWTN